MTESVRQGVVIVENICIRREISINIKWEIYSKSTSSFCYSSFLFGLVEYKGRCLEKIRILEIYTRKKKGLKMCAIPAKNTQARYYPLKCPSQIAKIIIQMCCLIATNLSNEFSFHEENWNINLKHKSLKEKAETVVVNAMRWKLWSNAVHFYSWRHILYTTSMIFTCIWKYLKVWKFFQRWRIWWRQRWILQRYF